MQGTGKLPEEVGKSALRTALRLVLTGLAPEVPIGYPPRAAFGWRWIACLHAAFEREFTEPGFAVFSRSKTFNEWRRSEYLNDLTVVKWESQPAPIRTRNSVPVIKQCIWQVESEIALSARAVSEDLGKLTCGSAASKLLIAATPKSLRNHKAWVSFIEEASRPIGGNFFLVLVPTYAGAEQGCQGWALDSDEFRFFSRHNGSLVEDELPIRPL